ncbi:9097_t:CDS:2, partial [Ambispora gerdemannii]
DDNGAGVSAPEDGDTNKTLHQGMFCTIQQTENKSGGQPDESDSSSNSSSESDEELEKSALPEFPEITPTNATHIVKEHKIPVFRGDDDDEDPIKWLNDLIKVSKANGWNKATALRQIPIALKDIAADWYQELTKKKKTDMDEFIKAFAKQFSDTATTAKLHTKIATPRVKTLTEAYKKAKEAETMLTYNEFSTSVNAVLNGEMKNADGQRIRRLDKTFGEDHPNVDCRTKGSETRKRPNEGRDEMPLLRKERRERTTNQNNRFNSYSTPRNNQQPFVLYRDSRLPIRQDLRDNRGNQTTRTIKHLDNSFQEEIIIEQTEDDSAIEESDKEESEIETEESEDDSIMALVATSSRKKITAMTTDAEVDG